jgi:hypothetical protein
MTVTRDTSIEDLVTELPDAVHYLMGKGIKAIACGQPVWGSLAEVARGEGYSDPQIEAMVSDLRAMSRRKATTSQP